MTLDLETLLQETLGDIEDLSPEKMHALIQEALKTFAELQESIHSPNQETRETALKAVLSLKETIQTQMDELSQKAGMDQSEFVSLVDNPEEFDPEIWLELNAAKKELDGFRR